MWAAQDERLDCPVAVKILRLVSDSEWIRRWEREAGLGARLRHHPGVSAVHDVGDHDGHPFFVMDLLAGQSFESLLTQHPSGLPVELSVELMSQVADTLRFAHESGALHGDMEPANLLWLADGRVKICNFNFPPSIRTGMALIAPAFMAPEQWREECLSEGTDMYSFGATLHAVLTGTPPFPGPDPQDFEDQHLNSPPPHLPEHLPAGLDALLQHLMAKEASRRPSAAEVRRSLDLMSTTAAHSFFAERTEQIRSENQQQFTSISALIAESQQARCPSVFTVVPTRKRRLGKTIHVLRLYCEEPGAWHALPGDEGCYKITELDPWLAKYGPVAQRVLAFLSKAVPVAGSAAGLASHVLDGQLGQDVNKMRELLTRKIPSSLGMMDNPDPARTLLPIDPLDPRARAESDADFRVLVAMLRSLDPNEHWGGLNRTLTPTGMTLYLCRDHAQS